MPVIPSAKHRRRAALAAIGVSLVAISLVGWTQTHPAVAFHIESDDHMNQKLRQITRHIEAHPSIPVRVILIAGGVRAVLDGASDPNGGFFSAQLEQLLAKNVRIFACENTLRSFNKSLDDLTFGIETVPSGIAELGRLQFELGFAYLKL